MQGTVLRALHALIYLILTITLWGWPHYIFCFTNNNVEAQKFSNLSQIIELTSEEPTTQILAIHFTLTSFYYLNFRLISVSLLWAYFLFLFHLQSVPLINYGFWDLIIKWTVTGTLKFGLLKRKLETILCNFLYSFNILCFQ